jgi:hypothetical protein
MRSRLPPPTFGKCGLSFVHLTPCVCGSDRHVRPPPSSRRRPRSVRCRRQPSQIWRSHDYHLFAISEFFYNVSRRRSSLGHKSPTRFLREWTTGA